MTYMAPRRQLTDSPFSAAPRRAPGRPVEAQQPVLVAFAEEFFDRAQTPQAETVEGRANFILFLGGQKTGQLEGLAGLDRFSQMTVNRAGHQTALAGDLLDRFAGLEPSQ